MPSYRRIKELEEDEDYRFAVDSNDRIYIARRNLQTLIAETPYKKFDVLAWGSLQVYARQLLCERVESSILNFVFPNLKLSGDGAECIWALFEDHIGLYHSGTGKLQQITSPGHASEDGPVWISGQILPQSALGTILDANNFVRIDRSIVILQGHRVLRLLDLKTWTLRTIISLDGYTYSIHPSILSTSSLPFVVSSIYIEITQSTGVFRMDLRTGETSVPPKLSLHGHIYDSIVPIPSSRSAPAYIIGDNRVFHLLRIVNGMVQTVKSPISKGHCAAHVASTGLTLLSTNSEASVIVSTSHKAGWSLHQWKPSHRLLPSSDLPSLINNDRFPYDFTIKNDSREWNVPLDIVTDLYPGFDGPKLQELIKPFPTLTVDAFMGRMLGKQLPDALCADSCRIWSHVIYLWRAVDAESNPVLQNFIDSVIPGMPTSLACDAFLDAWKDEKTKWTADDVIVRHLARHAKKSCHRHFSVTRTYDRNMEAALAISVLVDIAQIDPMAQELARKPVKQRTMKEFERKLKKRPTRFVFTFSSPGEVGKIQVGDARYLYVRWRWFKRLMDVDCHEKLNRIAEMPEWMSMASLRAILGCVHQERFTEVLSVSDALELLEHRQEIDICDADDTPVAPFVELYGHCMAVVFHQVTPTNIAGQLINYQRLGMVSKVGTLLSLVANGEYQLDASELIKALPLNLLALLKAEFDRLAG